MIICNELERVLIRWFLSDNQLVVQCKITGRYFPGMRLAMLLGLARY